jgi:hypothetical protein
MELPVALLRGEYSRLSSLRDPYLTRARDCSKFTIPALIPPAGYNGASKLKTTFSSYGARCVNSLASKLTLALFPAQAPFFKLIIGESTVRKITQPDMRSELEKGLASMEGEVRDEIETTATRPPATEAVKHLLVGGNVLTYLTPDNSLRVFPLGSYVCKRDSAGKVLAIVLEEDVSPMALPEKIRKVATEAAKEQNRNQPASAEKTIKLYTGIYRRESNWEVWQEVGDITVPGSRNQQPLDACPWMPLRWTAVDGEDYGRGMVEEYLGDLISLEGLTAALVKGTAASAKVVYLRNPNGTTKATALTRAETGDVIDGKADEVTVLQTEKRADFITAREMIQDIKEQLAFAFALNQAVQRQAERVTAEEIRFMAQELDSLLGGNYSSLSLEFQLPYLRRLMRQMEKQGRLPMLPKGVVKPIIVTGVAALGRGADLENLRAFVKDVVDLGGPEALETYIDFGDLMKRLSTARGIKADGLVKPPEMVAQEQQAKRQQEMITQLGPNAVNAAGGMAKQAMANGQPLNIPQPT